MAFRSACFFLTVAVVAFRRSDALSCFQCGDSSITGDCIVDTATMEAEHNRHNGSHSEVSDSDSPSKNRNRYIKKCNKNVDACIIERIEEQGLLQAYIRDCFSVNDEYSLESNRYDGLNKTMNHTSCFYDAFSKKVGCVTLCDTDLCNGPRIGSKASHDLIHTSLVFIFVFAWLSI